MHTCHKRMLYWYSFTVEDGFSSAKIDLSTTFADSFRASAISWSVIVDIGWPGPCVPLGASPEKREAAVGVDDFGCDFAFQCGGFFRLLMLSWCWSCG